MEQPAVKLNHQRLLLPLGVAILASPALLCHHPQCLPRWLEQAVGADHSREEEVLQRGTGAGRDVGQNGYQFAAVRDSWATLQRGRDIGCSKAPRLTGVGNDPDDVEQVTCGQREIGYRLGWLQSRRRPHRIDPSVEAGDSYEPVAGNRSDTAPNVDADHEGRAAPPPPPGADGVAQRGMPTQRGTDWPVLVIEPARRVQHTRHRQLVHRRFAGVVDVDPVEQRRPLAPPESPPDVVRPVSARQHLSARHHPVLNGQQLLKLHSESILEPTDSLSS
ncbi:MAG: hypothetical protein WKF50_06280 [Nocardioides sp.]